MTAHLVYLALVVAPQITAGFCDTQHAIDDSDNSVVYTNTWSAEEDSQGASNGTMHLTQVSGATASLSFTGALLHSDRDTYFTLHQALESKFMELWDPTVCPPSRSQLRS